MESLHAQRKNEHLIIAEKNLSANSPTPSL